MNIIELAKEANGEPAGPGGVDWTWDELEKFAELVAAQERKALEHKFARLQNLMDVREIQPNKPCCLAARADEREACIKLVHGGTGEPVQTRTLLILQKDRKRIEDAIRARGTI